MIHVFQNLLLSSSKAMNVDGSSVNKEFAFTATQPCAVLGLVCILRDEGTTSLNKFGAAAALSNGIALKTVLGGNATTLTTLKDNADLCTRFHFNQFGSGAILSILGIGTPEGFGNSNNVFVGYMDFAYPHFLRMAQDDVFKAVIQDNLSGLDLLEMAIKTCVDQ